MKKAKVYTVEAVRWGDKENHSYMIGVFDSKHKALEASKNEEEFRGGKYECEVLEWDMNNGNDCRMKSAHKVIKSIGQA